MGRRPIVYQDRPGTYNVRLRVPEPVWRVAILVGHEAQARAPGQTRKISDETAGQYGLAELFKGIAELFTDGDARWLPDREFARALTKLQDGNYGTIPTATDTIDISKLHRNKKLKSGFVGVYANGQGFRAMSRDHAGKAVAIGTFKTAEEAAHRRMSYHRQHNLAYGELEAEMEAWRADTKRYNVSAQLSDEDLIRQIKQSLMDAGTWDYVFGPGCVTIEPGFSSKLPRRADILAKPALQRQLTTSGESIQEPEPELEALEGEAFGFDPSDLPESLR